MNSEYSGPCPGDKVLLVSVKGDKPFELLRMIFEQKKGCLTIVSTVAEAISKLSEPFDLVWIQLPLPDLNGRLLIDLLLATPDLADRVGVMDPLKVTLRLLEMPILDIFEGLPMRDRRGIWIRIRTKDEREWVRHHLGQCVQR